MDESHWVRDKCVLVLGAGLGLEGLAAARVGATRVVLTDIGRFWGGRDDVCLDCDVMTCVCSVMQLLAANVADSGLSHVCSVQELPWGEGSWDKSLPVFDVIVAADVVYREDSAALLAETIACAIPVGSQAPFLLGEEWLCRWAECWQQLLTDFAGFTNRVIGADVFFDGM